MGSSPHVWFCACKSVALAHEFLVSTGPSPHLWFLQAKHRLLCQHTCLHGYQTSPVVLCIQNSVISNRITSFYGFQPSSVVLCIHHCVPSIIITNRCGSHPSSVVFGCKTATFGQEQQGSTVARFHLSFCACKTTWLAQEILASIGPSPHLWFLHAKQRLMDQKYKSLWVPDHLSFCACKTAWFAPEIEVYTFFFTFFSPR